ncbi:MerR family transcriptional regulator [Pseudaestuariivita sp.]|uniref:MerR family transcriptional regulator n=1 Tax=Pseudaestuariivita sp. TaxID=2211669 RepID=UPI004058F9D3
MAKSADAFRTISEVAETLGTPAHVLRFWESKFTQVKPVKRAGGRRYYRPADVALLLGIRRLLHDDGMTIKGVQKILREKGVKHVVGLTEDELFEDDAPVASPVAEAPIAVDVKTETAKVLPFKKEPEPAPAEAMADPAPAEPELPGFLTQSLSDRSEEAPDSEPESETAASAPATAEPAGALPSFLTQPAQDPVPAEPEPPVAESLPSFLTAPKSPEPAEPEETDAVAPAAMPALDVPSIAAGPKLLGRSWSAEIKDHDGARDAAGKLEAWLGRVTSG